MCGIDKNTEIVRTGLVWVIHQLQMCSDPNFAWCSGYALHKSKQYFLIEITTLCIAGTFKIPASLEHLSSAEILDNRV